VCGLAAQQISRFLQDKKGELIHKEYGGDGNSRLVACNGLQSCCWRLDLHIVVVMELVFFITHFECSLFQI